MSYFSHQFNLTFLREIIDTRDMLSMCMTLTKMCCRPFLRDCLKEVVKRIKLFIIKSKK